MHIVVTTPTGNIGHVVVERLLNAGADVTVIARNPDKLTPNVREKVTVHQGDLGDAAFVQKATENAEALFWLTPPNFTAPDWRAFYQQNADSAANAVRANHIPYVVHLSSAGAEHATGFGPVSFIQIVENALNATGANVLHLRPGFFYENFLAQVEPIKNTGKMFYGMPPEARFPLIATRDIGEAAARRLLAHDFSGVEIMGLHGPADVPTFAEAAQIIGEAIGKPVEYVQIPLDALKSQLLQMGASQSVADSYIEMTEAQARGAQPAEPRTPETTTPTTLKEWAAQVMAPALRK